jgi:hypothetical protein
MPLSQCIDLIAYHLNEYYIDTSSLHEVAERLDLLTKQVQDARCHGDTAAIRVLLEKTAMTMRDAGVIFRMLALVERSRLPEEMIEHLARIRRFNEQTFLETIALRDAF